MAPGSAARSASAVRGRSFAQAFRVPAAPERAASHSRRTPEIRNSLHVSSSAGSSPSFSNGFRHAGWIAASSIAGRTRNETSAARTVPSGNRARNRNVLPSNS
ncbi:MAG: hypothetical protein ACYS99_21360 [Planctomycetota bacterium]